MTSEIQKAQCVGLWLAEGDSTSKSEVTLTNNNSNIIVLFHNTLSKIFDFKNNPRVYVYSPSLDIKPTLPINVEHKYYIDRRANKPYFIYRIAGVSLVNDWRNIVSSMTKEEKFYKNILQGFFAGEGNIKFIKRSCSRTIRISQGQPNLTLEKILKNLNVKFIFSPDQRAYVISGRENLEKLANINIGILHLNKNEKLIEMMKTYKQYHFPKNYLKNEIVKILDKPFTSRQLSKLLNRSQARITRVLVILHKKDEVKNFRVHSVNFWVNKNVKIILISKRKQQILDLLNIPRKTSEISKLLKISWKSVFRRLKELEELNLVKRLDGLWYKIKTEKEVIAF